MTKKTPAKNYFDRRDRAMRAELRALRKNTWSQPDEKQVRRNRRDRDFVLTHLHLIPDRELANEVLRRRKIGSNLLKGLKFPEPVPQTPESPTAQ